MRARIQDRRTALARVIGEDLEGIQRLNAVLGELSFPESPALRVATACQISGLASAGVFTEIAPATFALTSIAERLKTDEPDSLRAWRSSRARSPPAAGAI